MRRRKWEAVSLNGRQQTFSYLLVGKSTPEIASGSSIVAESGVPSSRSGLHWMMHFEGESHCIKPTLSLPCWRGSWSSWAALIVPRTTECWHLCRFWWPYGDLSAASNGPSHPSAINSSGSMSVQVPWQAECRSWFFCLFVQQCVVLCRSLCSKTRFLKLLVMSAF